MKINNPLITVVVVTYNSSKYVLDTLDSVYNQTYKNIELIISDDCSTDSTLEICKQWLDSNCQRFAKHKLTRTPKNGGICKNYNHALSLATGEWIKYIAGDDMLTPDCVETYFSATTAQPHKIFIGALTPFTNEGETLDTIPVRDGLKNAKSVRDQQKFLVKAGTVIPGPTLFMETRWIRKEGGFEECYPMIEDYPLAMRSLAHGYFIGHVSESCINYRIYPESVSRSNNLFCSSIYSALGYYGCKAALKNKMYLWWLHYKCNKFISLNYNNQPFLKPLVMILRLLDPIYLNKKFRKH